jgi:hypothetical protein
MTILGLIARRYSGVPPGRRPDVVSDPGDKSPYVYCVMSLSPPRRRPSSSSVFPLVRAKIPPLALSISFFYPGKPPRSPTENEGRRGRERIRTCAKQIPIAGLLSYVPPGRVLAGAVSHDPGSLSAIVERSGTSSALLCSE